MQVVEKQRIRLHPVALTRLASFEVLNPLSGGLRDSLKSRVIKNAVITRERGSFSVKQATNELKKSNFVLKRADSLFLRG